MPTRLQHRIAVVGAGIAALTATVAISALAATAMADSTDDYPIPTG